MTTECNDREGKGRSCLAFLEFSIINFLGSIVHGVRKMQNFDDNSTSFAMNKKARLCSVYVMNTKETMNMNVEVFTFSITKIVQCVGNPHT